MEELATTKKTGMAAYLSSEAVKASISSVISQKDMPGFVSSVISAVNANPSLAECTKKSILSAALLGHALKLPGSPQLSYYYMVPFKNKKKDATGNKVEVTEAMFLLGWRGYVQLAIRTGQYKKLVATEIKQGELANWDPISEECKFEPVKDYSLRKSLPTIGYYAYFDLLNGFKKEIFCPREKMEEHATKYSATYRSQNSWVRDKSLWTTNFDDMAKKTLIRSLLSKWGVMSPEMAQAYIADMAVIREDGTPDYVDNVPDEPVKGVDPFAENAVIVDEPKPEVVNEA